MRSLPPSHRPPALDADSSRAREFLPLLDVLRLLASVAIVRYHMRGDFFFGEGFGLPLFLLMLFGLATSSTGQSARRKESTRAFFERKARYLLTPWLRWSVVYLAIAVLGAIAAGEGALSRLEPRMVLTGGHLSLWFLPFAACLLLPARVLARRLERVPTALAIVVLACAGSFAVEGASHWIAAGHPGPPFGAWARFAPAVFFGVALGRARGERSRGLRAALLVLLAGWMTVAWQLSAFHGVAENVPRQFALATVLVCLGFGLRPRVPRFVHGLATVTFGVYLVHPLVGKILATAFDVMAWPAALHAGVVWAGAAGAVLALRRLGVRWHELATPNTHARLDPSSRRVAGDANGTRRAA